MRSIMVRISATEFSATMAAIVEWLDLHRFEPTGYKYDQREDAVLVTIDLPTDKAARTFAMRFQGTSAVAEPRGSRGDLQ